MLPKTDQSYSHLDDKIHFPITDGPFFKQKKTLLSSISDDEHRPLFYASQDKERAARGAKPS
jgi:hypothetical protein